MRKQVDQGHITLLKEKKQKMQVIAQKLHSIVSLAKKIDKCILTHSQLLKGLKCEPKYKAAE